MSVKTCSALVSAILLAVASVSEAAQVQVCFWSQGKLHMVQREIAGDAASVGSALEALLAGPTEQEKSAGITSAIVPGTAVKSIATKGDTITIDFSAEVVAGITDASLESVFQQVRWTLEPYAVADIRLTAAGADLSDYLPAAPTIKPRTDKPTTPVAAQVVNAAGSALAGRTISISPGHGLRWNGGSWAYERPIYCAPLNNEDLHNVELVAYLNAYLLQDSATTKVYRCLDKNFGNYSPGRPWWTVSAGYWLEHLGYPCSVVASVSGQCPLGGGTDDSSDSLRSRPLASDYDNTEIYVSMHTNGNTGDCTGTGCANGTCTYYDAGTEHAQWGTISQTLAQRVNNSLISVIRNGYGDTSWRDRGALNANGAYAETRIPNRAAILIELAFHDTCDRDGLYLQDEFFRSATMWAVYKGICDYSGTVPTYDLYSSEYVSDTIPSQMLPGQTYDVSITFRNNSVLWTPERQFRLGAVDDSDPFGVTRVSLNNNVDLGQTYTFEFTMTAPTTPGIQTTDWRMVRDGVTWFGPTFAKQVQIARTYPRGDYNLDHEVDLEDFAHLQICYTNTGVAVTDPNCLDASLDLDNDVDSADFAIFQACFQGPGVIVDPYCGG